MKQHVYFIPGMSASSTIFERIKLPTDLFEIHHIEWLQPLSINESLDKYIDRISLMIQHPNPIFIGVSFGGIIAQELSLKFHNSKVIIISSIQHQDERPSFLKFVQKTNLYYLYPVTLINILEKGSYHFANYKLKRQLDYYRKYLPLRNRIYTMWAIKTFLKWKQKSFVKCLHLHGDKDFMLPIKNIKNGNVIYNGTHAMILTKSSSIQSKIVNYLT